MADWLSQLQVQALTGLLIFVRIGAAVVSMPIYGAKQTPTQIRVGLSVALTLVVAPLLPLAAVDSTLTFAGLALKEAIVGLVIGLTATMIFAAAQIAGEMLDVQSGLSIASVINPTAGVRSTLLGQAQYMLAVLICLATGAYQWMIRALVESYRLCGLGGLTTRPEAMGGALSLMGHVLLVSVQLAAPVAAALFLTEAAMGLANRALPQMNVMILALPVKVLVAVTVLAAALPGVAWLLARLFDGLGRDIGRMVSLLSAAGVGP